MLLNCDCFCYILLNVLRNNKTLLSVRERTTEVEREIERQRSLELERTKTRELRHHLDMEKEKQSQVREAYC